MNLNNLVKKDNKEDEEKQFNLKVFDNEIVYSTNSNFEFVYLFSLFRKISLRSRPYDVVIVDEVDNMFLDQSTSPAIIAYGVSILYHKDILEIIYLLKDNDVNDIIKVLKYYFPEGIDFPENEILKLKKSAISAERHEKNVDYIIENNKIIILDRTTGYKKPGSRWQNCIHEFVEIKEGIEVKKPQISTC
jgi:preprotein translocase subunit SecA